MEDENRCRAFTISYDVTVENIRMPVGIEYAGKHVNVVGLWDTGATKTCISLSVVKQLGLIPTGKTNMRTATEERSTNMYVVVIELLNGIKISDVCVREIDIDKDGLGVLIGMDIIGLGDFAISNHGGKTVFTFRAPSSKVIDFITE